MGRMGCRPIVLIKVSIKMINNVAHKNSDIDGTCKRSFANVIAMMLTKHFLNILQGTAMMPHSFELAFQLHGFSRLSFAPCLLQKKGHEHSSL